MSAKKDEPSKTTNEPDELAKQPAEQEPVYEDGPPPWAPKYDDK